MSNIYSYHRLLHINENCPVHCWDDKGLLRIHIILFQGDTNLGYIDDQGKEHNNDEVRKGKNNDIRGMGGFIAYAQPSSCCCSNGVQGSVKLVQLIRQDDNSYIVDTDEREVRAGKAEPGKKHGYLEHGTGRPYPKPGWGYGYIDAPGLIKNDGNNKLQPPIRQYGKLIRIEAYCDCGTAGDQYLNHAAVFYFSRSKFANNGSIIPIFTGNDGASRYPIYIPPVKKGLYPWE